MRFIVRILAPLVPPLLLLGGCGSGQPQLSSSPDRVVTSVSTPSGTFEITRHVDTRGSYHRLPFPVEQVWPALLAGLDDLGIALGTSDRSQGLAGNRQLVVNRTLGGQPLARSFECGSTATGAPIANSYSLRVSVLTQIEPHQGDGTRVQTRIEAAAVPPGGGNTVQCGSTGFLEQRIASRIAEHLGS